LPCEYNSPTSESNRNGISKSNTSPASTGVLPSSKSPSNPPNQFSDSILLCESKERRLLEMKLLHQFCTSTATKDFLSSHDVDVVDLWQIHAPSLAFEHSFLLNAMLAVAALHLTKINPDQRLMADYHRHYFSAALTEQRQILDSISAENAEAVCLATILITFPVYLLQNLEFHSYSPPLSFFQINQGKRTVMSRAIPILPDGSKIIRVVTAKPNYYEIRDEIFREANRKPFEQLMNWRASNEIVDSESQIAYEEAFSFIGYISACIDEGTDPFELRRLLLSFPSLVSPMFVNLLVAKAPRALACLAYYFALFKAADNVWWMRGIAEREVFGIQIILAEQWQWTMAWPLQKLASYAVLASTPP
jgi:hypothetical protein